VKEGLCVVSENEQVIQEIEVAIEIAQTNDLEEIFLLVESAHLSTEYLDRAEVLLVAREKGNKIIGCIGIERRENRVYIQSLSVDKNYRKLGIGRKLTDRIFEECVNGGEILIALTLFFNNHFYEKIGFTRINAQQTKSMDDIAGREKHKYCTAWGKRKE
jgi:N-acetylglutamate synthase-like GNAT family acetyltransferase